ncbi:MAG: DUF1549 domain-containing protein [Phycisphaera sp.]|nr:DUF1549 domain-containing protein [Phycisphaera sp.]
MTSRTARKQRTRIAWMVTLMALTAIPFLRAATEPDAAQLAEGEKLFATQVLPLLQSKCFACHGEDPKKIKAKLNMMSRDGLLKGGESGDPMLVPGEPDKSLMYIAVTWKDEDLEMPPKMNDRLSDEQVALLRKWIEDGAPWPGEARITELKKASWALPDAKGAITVRTSGGLTDDWTYRRYDPADLWAYRPVVQPAVPTTPGRAATNPIDAFINHKLAEAKLQPAPRADKRTLIRRATYDLTGLPPTPAEVDAFVSDKSPEAWEKLVDRLLASPRYGERMAQHWLDVARYADTNGFANDYVRPNAWRYRDYVIRSFNDDKPYDRFVREQIAGDEIDPSNPENLIAVGFLRAGPWEHTGMSVAAVTRQLFLDDVTNEIGVTFLGNELRCCKCHDHKFDPIPTRDYYRMQSVFAPVQFADRNAPFLDVENTAGMEAGRERVQRLLNTQIRSLRTIDKSEWPVETFDEDTEKKGHDKVNKKQRQLLNAERLRYEPWAFSVYDGPERTPKSGMKMSVPDAKELAGEPQQINILKGGSIEAPGEAVTPGVLSIVESMRGEKDPGAAASVTTAMQGRRAQLADWIASPDNPLTTRVIVNRIWLWHFGRAIAANPNNFGKMGAKPTHPELLDWLASRFVAEGWSFKKMHKLIMTSEAYQRASTHDDLDAIATADANNELLSYFTPRRLTAEELRDAMLLTTGELNTEMGGLPAHPALNMEVAMQPRHIMGSVGSAYQPDLTPAQRNRRTIYAERIRTLGNPMLEVFNQPTFDISCERRDASTVTPQVFTLFNSVNSYDRAIAMALRVEKSADTLDAQVDAAFRLTLGRAPSADERDKAIAHVERLTAQHAAHPPARHDPPKYVIREMVEEMTGLNFFWVEDLDVYASKDYVPDVKPWDVDAPTRALADLCLVLFNTNEFIYVY